MPVPTLVTDLSTTLASNSPSGSDNVFPDLDNYLRALSGFVASIRDNSGNGWVSPYLPLAGGTVTGATTFSSTVALNGALSGTGLTTYLASPPAIGGTTPNTGAFTTLAASSDLTLSGGTANGVLYLNGSKVATSGSALTFDGSNLGLGVTPSAWISNAKALQISTFLSAWQGSNGSANLGFGVYEGGINTYQYATTGDAPTMYRQLTGQHAWFTAPSGTAGNAISFTQAMTLDASGRLLIGATSGSGSKVIAEAANAVAYAATSTLTSSQVNIGVGVLTTARPFVGTNTNSNPLEIGTRAAAATIFVTDSTERARISAAGGLSVGTTDDPGAGNVLIPVGKAYTTFTANYGIGTPDSNGLQIFTGDLIRFGVRSAGVFTERARITSGGDLLVGTTTSGAKLTVEQGGANANGAFITNQTYNYQTLGLHNTATANDNLWVIFGTEASITTRGSIDYNRAGGLVRYNTTSDYRAKDIIGPVQNPGATIDALKVYEGVMKGATQSRPMLIAHEAQEHAPYAVSGVKDEVNEDGTPKFQQMDVSSLVPLLLAEIQSLRARVAALEAQP